MIKKITKRTLLSTSIAILLALSNGCNPGVEHPKNACKLIKISYMGSYSTRASSSGNTTFDYNDKDQLIGTMLIGEEKDNLGGLKLTSSSSQSEYDADGYVIKATGEYKENSTPAFDYTYASVYKYQNKRLIETRTETFLSGSISSVDTHLYGYDADGNLSKYTFTSTFGSSSTSNIFDFKTKKITVIGYSGAQAEGELDVNGYIIKDVNLAGIERRYQYNINGDLIRQEDWTKGKIYHAIVYEYDTKKNPNYSFPNLAEPKGIPELKIYRSVFPIHNYTKETEFNINTSGNETVRSIKTYSSQYNTSGYATNISISEEDDKGVVISTTNREYTYKDCQ